MKKEPKKSSLMLFFYKIIKSFCPPHPDRCTLWVAATANAKEFNIL